MTVAKTRKQIKRRRALAEALTGLFRATLLFGPVAAALVLIVVPDADHRAKFFAADRSDTIDRTTTGSIGGKSAAPRDTIRQNGLDRPGRGPCLMFPDGSQRGSC